jgi:hypothetical protein
MSDGTWLPRQGLPEVPQPPSISLPGGTQLQGFLDFSQGIPDEGAATFSLLTQLAPAMGSMACLLKVLAAIQTLSDVLKALPGLNPIEIGETTGEALQAIADLATCFASLQPPGIAVTIKGALELVIKFLESFLSRLEPIIRAQQDLDLSAATDNPAMAEALAFSEQTLERSRAHLMASLGPVQPLLDMISNLEDIVGMSLGLPSLTDIGSDGEPAEVIAQVRETIDIIKQVIESLPG